MHSAFTVTFIILAAIALRRSLLPEPGAQRGPRFLGRGHHREAALVPVPAQMTKSPHPVMRSRKD